MKNQTLINALLLTAVASSSDAFVVNQHALLHPQHLTDLTRIRSSVASDDFAVHETSGKEVERGAPRRTNSAPKAKSLHKEGIFSPAVNAAKFLLGEKKLNEVRAKAISLHSDIISKFVDTSNSDVGNSVLTNMFLLMDKDKNGTLSEDELAAGLQALGFTWISEKQAKGILARADKDANGVLDFKEFEAEAPKTLRTNLIKLAKKNGGELGFLA